MVVRASLNRALLEILPEKCIEVHVLPVTTADDNAVVSAFTVKVPILNRIQRRLKLVESFSDSLLIRILELKMRNREVVVNDLMQQGYVYYLTEPEGENFDPEFRPELTPQEMLELGVFGGKYMTDCREEFPAEWFEKAKLCHERHDPELNFFRVNASKPLSYWREKGWIHSDDPRGWFQWYCRYYMGRRGSDDARQIRRWKAMKRHIAQITRNCMPGDINCRRRQRQALLHWAYDSRLY